MADSTPEHRDFLNQLNPMVEQNISNEQFGVSELAEAMNMSRSNLLRKVKKATNLSVSQLISQVRLQRAMELLRTTSLNVSEVSHEVGFNSTSYFIKCFREYYGYPPGEANKRASETPAPVAAPPVRSTRSYWLVAAFFVTACALGWVAYAYWPSTPETPLEKSIVVLPFKNDSADSSNVYIINGLMEATLNNLQKIKDLKVLSRTSAEKYRHSNKSIPEMAKELNANYFVEGSGQKIGDHIVLNIQLIDGTTDRHLWSKQYRREANDIFTLQQHISKDIAWEIQAVITPEEKNRLEKVYTNNQQAFDAFLKGLDLFYRGKNTNLVKSLAYFEEAIALDNSFALAYACASMNCYYLDLYQAEKKYADRLSQYADNAMLYDPTASESLTAKAMHYLIRKEYAQALPFLEKALSHNPNSTQLMELLADFYTHNLPNTEKYLEYALKGLRLGAASGDSVSISYFYLRLGNALIQTGFVDESLKALDQSLLYYSNNAYSHYLRAFVLYAKNKDLKQTQRLLQVEFNKDTTRFDILQDIGKVSYYLGEFDTAYYYYKRFNAYRDRYKLDVYRHENMNIGLVYQKMGEHEKGKAFIEDYRKYFETDQTVYKNLGLAFYYCHTNESAKALEHLRLFAREDNIQYWFILFVDDGPDKTKVEELPEFKKLMKEIERKFWANHEKFKARLIEEGVVVTITSRL